MATKTDFTEVEWAALQKGVTGAGMLVSVGDPDFSDSFGEASALAKYLAAQHETGPTPFIRELAHTRGTGFGMTASPQKVETETIEALGAAQAILAAKAPDEEGPYRDLVLGTATAVADAKGGESAAEESVIAKLEQALSPS